MGSVERKFAVSCWPRGCRVHSVISIGRALRSTTTFSWYDLLRWPLRLVRHPTREIGPPLQPAHCCFHFFPPRWINPVVGCLPSRREGPLRRRHAGHALFADNAVIAVEREIPNLAPHSMVVIGVDLVSVPANEGHRDAQGREEYPDDDPWVLGGERFNLFPCTSGTAVQSVQASRGCRCWLASGGRVAGTL